MTPRPLALRELELVVSVLQLWQSSCLVSFSTALCLERQGLTIVASVN
jgi:hypothetical protein